MVERVVAVNISKKPSGLVLREDLHTAIKGKTELSFEDSSDWWLNVKTGSVQIMSRDQELKTEKTFFFIRSRKSSPLLALTCHLFTLEGVPFTDQANEYHTYFSNKSFAIPRLAFHGLPVPHSIVVQYKTLKKYIEHIELQISYPCVVKGDGSKGKNVYLVHSKSELLSVAETIYVHNKSVITIQEMIENEYDVRALFMGTSSLGAIKRVRNDDEPFLNNISMGAKAFIDELSDEEMTLCKKACEVSYLDLCGIDFIRTPDGIRFLEINKTPQMDGFRKVHPELSIGEALETFIDSH